MLIFLSKKETEGVGIGVSLLDEIHYSSGSFSGF
jgi:hypothetical protein